MNTAIKNPLKVSLIIIGDEILNGRTQDLNASWLARFLFKKGLLLCMIRFIRDDEPQLFESLKASIAESDIVITSGGIGPTKDDLTKNGLASFFNKPLSERQDVAEIVRLNYERFGRTWNPTLNHYHLFPQDFMPVNNPKGQAPGLSYYDKERHKIILAAPGVPAEFSQMCEQEFITLIERFFPAQLQANFQTVIRTTGIPEEKIFFDLCPALWQELEAFGKVSSLPHTIGVDIVISYTGHLHEHERKEKQITALIKNSLLANYVWQFGNKSINELVLDYAKKHQFTVAFAESCTGGLAASKLTDLPGSSDVFSGSVVSYANEAKTKFLGVKKQTLHDFGAVSAETAKEMAVGAREQFNTDFAVSISGIAGPGGGSPSKPVGTVVIGYATKNKSGAKSFWFPGERLRLKERFSDMALLTMLKCMQGSLDY